MKHNFMIHLLKKVLFTIDFTLMVISSIVGEGSNEVIAIQGVFLQRELDSHSNMYKALLLNKIDVKYFIEIKLYSIPSICKEAISSKSK